MSQWHTGPLDGFRLWSTIGNTETARMSHAAYVRHESPNVAPRSVTCVVSSDEPDGLSGRQAAQWAREMIEGPPFMAPPLVVWDAPFTLTVVDRDIRRCGGTGPLGIAGRLIIDPYVLARGTNPALQGPFGLRDLYADFGIRHGPDIAGDAFAAVQLAREIGRAHPEVGNMTDDELHGWQVMAAGRIAGQDPRWERGRSWPLLPPCPLPPPPATASAPDWTEFRAARDELLRAAFRCALTDLRTDDNIDELEEADRADLALATAARALDRATDKLTPVSQPHGWSS